MGGSFGAQTQAIASAAGAFGAQADPILQQAERLQTVEGTAQTTGRDYAAQGDSYRQALTGPLAKIVRTFGERCISVSDRLTRNQQDYDGADASGSAGLRASGGSET
jgi:hypothetical protein